MPLVTAYASAVQDAKEVMDRRCLPWKGDQLSLVGLAAPST